MKPIVPYVYPVRRRKAPASPVVRTIHDAGACIGMSDQKRPEPVLRTSFNVIYCGKNQRPSSSTSQGFVYEHGAVFSMGNPRTTGATGGERRIVSRTNISRITPQV